MILIKAGETTASRLRVFFQLVDATDGLTPETGEEDGQPQISINGEEWTDTGIGTLVDVGHGRYYAELDPTVVATTGVVIETRFKSANTAECPGDSVQVVAFDPHDSAGLGLSRVDEQITKLPEMMFTKNTGKTFGDADPNSVVAVTAGNSSGDSAMTPKMVRQLAYKLQLDGTHETPSVNGTTAKVSVFDHDMDEVAVKKMTADALADFYTEDTGEAYADAHSQSVVKGIVANTITTSRDFSDNEVKQIRHRLGVDGDTIAPSAIPSLGNLPVNVKQVNGVNVSSIADFNADTANVAAIKAKTDSLTFTSGNLHAIAQDIATAALARFLQTNTGYGSAVDNSVAKVSQGSAGGNVTVEGFTENALEQLSVIQLDRMMMAILKAKARKG